MSIYYEENEVIDVIYSSLPDFPCKLRYGSAINCKGRSIFLGNSIEANSKQVYEMRNGGYHALPELNIGRRHHSRHQLNVARRLASVCYINKRLIVLGGVSRDAEKSIETFQIEASNNDTKWKISQSSLPIPLIGHKTIDFKNNIFVVGGSSNGYSSNRVWEGKLLPANKIVWKEIGNMNYKRRNHFLFSFQDKLIVFGGNKSISYDESDSDLSDNDLSDAEKDRVEFLDGKNWKLGPSVPFDFSTGKEQCVLDRQGRITIISNNHGVVVFDIKKEKFKHYPDFGLRESRTGFTALLQ